MQRQTRNSLCIWLIGLGLVNFLAYTVMYAELGGDARNGGIEISKAADGSLVKDYYVRGHFIRMGTRGEETPVSKGWWIYSYLHSISIWPTQGMLMICMLILARPHIIATMQESWVSGPTFITVAITLVTVIYSAMTLWFFIGFWTTLGQGPV